MSVYYLSREGSDCADGLSPDTAWQTIACANARLQAGDTLLFRRGDTFYGRVLLPHGLSHEHPTVCASYGEGEKPVISQYKRALPRWERSGEHVWRLALSDPSCIEGNTDQMDVNAGFLKIDGVLYGHKCFSIDQMAAQWDFYNDDTNLYVFCEENPAHAAREILIACNIGCLPFRNHIRIDGLHFRGSGGHGISGVGHDAVITNCEFHELGGSQLAGFPVPNTRYGNGVECWSDSADILVESCCFSDIYDVAVTMQGNNVRQGWRNIVFRRCVMWNNQQSFEIWSDGELPGTGFIDCVFEDNLCLDAGFCWSYAFRPDRDNAAHLLMYNLKCPLCGVTVRNNVFSNARSAPIYKHGGASRIPADYVLENNLFLISPRQDPVFRGSFPDEGCEAFLERLHRLNRLAETHRFMIPQK